jgi:hypothetical protein
LLYILLWLTRVNDVLIKLLPKWFNLKKSKVPWIFYLHILHEPGCIIISIIAAIHTSP